MRKKSVIWFDAFGIIISILLILRWFDVIDWTAMIIGASSILVFGIFVIALIYVDVFDKNITYSRRLSRIHGKVFEANMLESDVVGLIVVHFEGIYLCFNKQTKGANCDKTEDKDDYLGCKYKFYVGDLKKRTRKELNINDFKILNDEK